MADSGERRIRTLRAVAGSLPWGCLVLDQTLAGSEAHICSICTGVMVRSVTLPVCGHRFGLQCLSQWVGTHGKCPQCRAPVAQEEGSWFMDAGREREAREFLARAAREVPAITDMLRELDTPPVVVDEVPEGPMGLLALARQRAVQEGFAAYPACRELVARAALESKHPDVMAAAADVYARGLYGASVSGMKAVRLLLASEPRTPEVERRAVELAVDEREVDVTTCEKLMQIMLKGIRRRDIFLMKCFVKVCGEGYNGTWKVEYDEELSRQVHYYLIWAGDPEAVMREAACQSTEPWDDDLAASVKEIATAGDAKALDLLYAQAGHFTNVQQWFELGQDECDRRLVDLLQFVAATGHVGATRDLAKYTYAGEHGLNRDPARGVAIMKALIYDHGDAASFDFLKTISASGSILVPRESLADLEKYVRQLGVYDITDATDQLAREVKNNIYDDDE